RGGHFACGEAIHPERTDSFSFGCWFFSANENPTCALLAKLDAHTGTGFDWWLQNGRLVATLTHNFKTGNPVKVQSVWPLANAQWHHVFVTYDGSSRATGFKVFLDGTVLPIRVADNHLTETIQTTVPLTIGSLSGILSNAYHGQIDDIRIYSRRL